MTHIGKCISSNYPHIESEVRYAVRKEYTCTAIDVLACRTRLEFLNAESALGALPKVIELVSEELGWDKKWQEQEFMSGTQF